MKFTGKIDANGVLAMNGRELLTDWLRQHPEKHIELEIKVRRKQRSTQQNKYYWPVVVGMVCEALRHLGHDVDEQETHELLKSKFNSEKIVNDETGEVLEIPKSTARLNTVEMMDYIAKIQMWAAEFLNIVIPDPDTQVVLFSATQSITNQSL